MRAKRSHHHCGTERAAGAGDNRPCLGSPDSLDLGREGQWPAHCSLHGNEWVSVEKAVSTMSLQ